MPVCRQIHLPAPTRLRRRAGHSFSIRTSPEVRARLEGVLSPMGDFSQVMTVRQLADLVEYLRTTPGAP